MPTSASRARRWVKQRKATYFWNKGIFCVRLNVGTGEELQPIAVGVDPGSKKEGYSVKSGAHTYLNLQSDAVDWVKDRVEARRSMRRNRRQRNTPYRANRMNRKRGGIPPSTKARWGWKLRLLNWLRGMYPITDVVVEDIKAVTKGKRRWDVLFSPLQVGKEWFYSEVQKFARLTTYQGWQTAEIRKSHDLKKLGNKMSNDFHAHCVDAWCLANEVAESAAVDNKKVVCIEPIKLYYRQLHVMTPANGGERRNYGGTMSMGIKRGTLVSHPKWKLAYVGGTSNDRISLHNMETGRRLCQNAKPRDCTIKTGLKWRVRA